MLAALCYNRVMRFLITGGRDSSGRRWLTTSSEPVITSAPLDDLSAAILPSRCTWRLFFARRCAQRAQPVDAPTRRGCVYHLAARISVPESVLYPLEYNDVNVGGTVALLTAVRDVGVPQWC